MKHGLGVLVIAALGCGGGGSGDLALEDFATEMGAATCAKIFDCCTEPELMAMFEGIDPPIDSIEACNDFYGGLLTALFVPVIRDGQEAGRLIYHPDRAGECLDVVTEMSCAEFAAVRSSESFGGCQSPVEPLVEDGGTCFSDDECLSGYCDDSGEDDGVCAELPGEGEACTGDCADGFYCGFDQETFEQVCQPLLADGSECDVDGACLSGTCSGGDPQAGTPDTCTRVMTCDGV